MDERLIEISALLLKEYLFQGLDVGQIQYIASQFRLVRYRPNQTVIYEDMPGLNFYIVYKGQVKISTIIKKPFQRNLKANLYDYGPGNFFGEEALLFNQNNKDIVKTTEETILLIMDKVNFDFLMERFPIINKKLKATAESRRLARTRRFPWFAEGEALHLMGRKHVYFLFRSLILPIFLFLLSIPVILYTFTQLGTSSRSILFQAGSLFMLVGSVAWGIWNWVDWGNDYYIITSQRVLWLEKVVGIYDNRNEAPLYTILTVDVVSSQFGRIFGYGNVSTRTYTGTINMNNVVRPNELAAVIEGLIKRLLQLTKAAELSQIKQDVKKALGRGDPTMPDLEELVVMEPAAPMAKKKRKLSMGEQMQRILKVRYEQDGVITYRKHWFLLFQKSWLPLLLMVILIFIISLLPSSSIISSQSSGLVVLISIAAFIGLISWITYSYVDWKNDIYMLTPEQIFQIYRKPLGSELKSSASIENILTIVHERENLTGIMLNFGTVTVSVGDTEIIFDGVFNPDQVHQDIANYQEALKHRKGEQKANDDRKRMVNWLMTYNKEVEKNEEGEISPESDQISG